MGELTQALLLVNSSVAQVETDNNNAVKYNDSLCEVGLNIGREKSKTKLNVCRLIVTHGRRASTKAPIRLRR